MTAKFGLVIQLAQYVRRNRHFTGTLGWWTALKCRRARMIAGAARSFGPRSASTDLVMHGGERACMATIFPLMQVHRGVIASMTWLLSVVLTPASQTTF